MVIAALVAALLTRLAIPWLERQGAVAHENARTMHSGAVPKGGGLALLVAAAVAIIVTGFAAGGDWPPRSLIGGTVALAILSWRDDVGDLPAVVRFCVHLAVAAWAVLSLPDDARVFQGYLPHAADRLLAVIALGWMMNLFNFMDGINAIAGAEMIAIAAGYLALGLVTAAALLFATLAAALIGASAGFLIWNARARPLVFLGDVGSVPLGYLAGVLMIDLAVAGHWAAALILPAYFLLDATLTLLRRVAAGERPWQAHRSHAYQRAARAIGAHLPVVAWISLANALLIVAALASVSHPAAAIVAAVAILAALMLKLERAGRSRSSDSGP